MKRITKFLVLAALLSPVTVLAADVTMTNDVTLAPSNGSTYTLNGASQFDTLTTTGSDWAFALSNGGSVRITSSDKYNFTVDPANFSTNCGSSESNIGISVPTGASSQTITVTPSVTSCSTTASNGASGGGILYTSSGGGGGGGGSSSVSTATTQVATTKTTTTLPATTIAQPSTVAQTVSPVFNVNLSRGSSGDDVKRLQQLLKQDKSVYPEGVANGVYGPATARAVKAFQKKYGIIQTGTVGPATRAKIQVVFKETATTTLPATTIAQPSTVAQTASPVFNVNLSRGSRGDDVKRLQELLSQDKTIYPEGIANGTYGPATEKAIQRFQEKYGIAQKGITGYGRLGPATRAKIQEVFKETGTTIQSSATAGSSDQTKALQDQLKILQDMLNALKK